MRGAPSADGFMAAEIIPAQTNAAMQLVLNKLGVRRAIVLIEDEVRETKHIQAPRSRRRTSIASDIGFQDIISKVNTTYDMDKITPSSAPSFILDQHGANTAAKSSHLSLTGSKSSLNEGTAEPSFQPPKTFLRRMSLGAMELMRGFRPPADRPEGESSAGALPKTSAASLLPKKYVNSIYEDAEDDEGEKDGETEQSTEKVDSASKTEVVPQSRLDILVPEESKPPTASKSPLAPSNAVPAIALKEEPEDDNSSTTSAQSHEPLQKQSSHWELAAVQRKGSVVGGLGFGPVSAHDLSGTASRSALEISRRDAEKFAAKSTNDLPQITGSGPNRSRRPSLSIPIPKSPSGLKVDTLGAGNQSISQTLKPSRSIGALSIGGHVATPETNPTARRRGSGASFINAPAMVIPSSPSRSDLMKIQGFSTTKSGEIVVASSYNDDDVDGGDRTADIDVDVDEPYPDVMTEVELRVAPQDRSRNPSFDRNARNPSVVQIPKLPTMARTNSTASKYIEVLGRLRKTNATDKPAEIKSFGRVVQLAADLKKVGEDPTLATELDSATLQMVIGLKKWARSMRQKKVEKSHVHETAEAMNIRMANELPRPLHQDLIVDVIPVIESYYSSYKKQLGEKHSFTIGCGKHLEKLRNMERERSFTLADMPTEEQERAAANAMQIQLSFLPLIVSYL
ncbi:hypothetical protein HDU67_004050 [Dinochytrium kinnereticum]|nr:hypothetical protein HDU67_004050 [Dinochytrium kinnereticum]